MKKIASLPLLFICVVLLMAGNCPQNTGTGDDDSAAGTPSETPPQSALGVEFGELSFTHTYGTSPCPQDIGSITITNSTDAEATFDVSDDGTLVMFSMASGTIAAGQSVTIDVQFNCGDCVAAGFTSTVTVNVNNGSKTNSQTGTVTGSFMGCP